MTAGIQLFNDGGSVIFDQDYTNVSLKTKGTVTIGAGGYTTVQVANCIMPVVALKFSGVGATYQWYSSNGTTLNIMMVGTIGASVTYYVFDQPGAPANYGLVIYRADGSVAFDATKQYARVADVWAGANFITNTGTRVYTSGRTYAVVFGKMGHWHNGYNVISGTHHVWHDDYQDTQVSMSSNQVTVGSVTHSELDPDGSQSPAYVQSSESWSIMVLDVTGY